MARTVPPQLETDPPVTGETSDGFYPTSATRRRVVLPSLPESHRTIPFSSGASWFRKILAFAGPWYLVAVGYMDPGNWATDIGGGSKFGYTLLSVILISNLMAMFLQALSAKLGIATGRDLAQACCEHYSRRTSLILWVICELAIAACDLAEVLGSAVALNFGEIGGGNGQFANHPKNQRGASRIVLAASLREVPSGGDAKFRRESLQEHRHQIADQYDAEKRVAEFRAAAQVGSPVARVHVAHGYQIARPREGQNLAEPVRAGSDGNRAMGFGQGRDGREPGPVYCGEGVSGGFSGEGGVRFELWRSSGFHR